MKRKKDTGLWYNIKGEVEKYDTEGYLSRQWVHRYCIEFQLSKLWNNWFSKKTPGLLLNIL